VKEYSTRKKGNIFFKKRIRNKTQNEQTENKNSILSELSNQIENEVNQINTQDQKDKDKYSKEYKNFINRPRDTIRDILLFLDYPIGANTIDNILKDEVIEFRHTITPKRYAELKLIIDTV
jgi:hypothetical protein